MKRSEFSGEDGFSLIEVVAAIAVLAFAITALLKLSSGGLRLARAVEDKTALVAAADGTLRAFLAEGARTEGLMRDDGNIECLAEVFPFRKEEGRAAKLMKVVVTARNKATGAEFTLTSLKRE